MRKTQMQERSTSVDINVPGGQTFVYEGIKPVQELTDNVVERAKT